MPSKPSKNPLPNLYRQFWKYSAGLHKRVVTHTGLSIIGSTINLAPALVVAHAFNNLQFDASDPRMLSSLIWSISGLVLINLLFWAFHGTARVIEMNNAFLIRKNYKNGMVDKVLALPIDWHKKNHSGDTIDKINKASDALMSFSTGTFNLSAAFVKIGGSFIVICLFEPWAGLIAATVLLASVFVMLKYDEALKGLIISVFKFENHLASAVHDYISNIFSIITLRLHKRVHNEIDTRSLKGYPDHQRFNKINELKWFSVSTMISVMVFIGLSVYAYVSFRSTGVIVIGTLFALFTYLKNIGDVCSEFAYRYGALVNQDTALRAADIINDEYAKVLHQENLSLPKDWKEIEIKNLSFTYINEDEPEKKAKHLEHIDINIKRNQKIAFIGESGSGKSTTLSLLRGLYEPEHAEVLVDGKEAEGGLSMIYDHVTLIPQEPELFNSTVLDNITMEMDVAPEVVEKVMDMAQFQSVLVRLPKGLDTHVLEKGVSLSGGEKQRLALARGFLAAQPSDFVFLDEPTSSVDFANEMKIYENVIREFADRTVISTVHNLSLLKYFDYIYLFGNGKLLTSGTFDKLLKNKQFNKVWEDYNKTL